MGVRVFTYTAKYNIFTNHVDLDRVATFYIVLFRSLSVEVLCLKGCFYYISECYGYEHQGALGILV